MAINVKSNNNDIEIRFNHMYCDQVEDTFKKVFESNVKYKNLDKCSRCTLVTIYVNKLPATSGVSFCSKEDNFCKSFGRKTALSRAIKSFKNIGSISGLMMDKDLSSKIWTEYHNRCK